MHVGRPVDFTMNLTNNGESSNELLYMFANGSFVSALATWAWSKGETGNITYMYMTDDAGDHTLTWSWNEDGTNPIASRTITIANMPAATLTATIKVLNVTDADNHIITSDKFSIEVNVTNAGSTPYDEDISAKLYKNTSGNSGSNIQAKNQHLSLQPGATATLRFDMDNVIDGWKYFVKTLLLQRGQ